MDDVLICTDNAENSNKLANIVQVIKHISFYINALFSSLERNLIIIGISKIKENIEKKLF